MMKRYLMLYAFILSTLTLLAHDDKVTSFEQFAQAANTEHEMRFPRIGGRYGVFPGWQVPDVSSLPQG